MIATLALGSLGNVSALAGGLLTRTVPVDLGRIASPDRRATSFSQV